MLVLEVLAAVYLDDKPAVMAVEVQHIRPERLLPSEFRAAECAVAQVPPKEALSLRLIVSEFSG